MGKVIQFRPPRPTPKLVPRVRIGKCTKCGHKMDVHVTHPNGELKCIVPDCPCRTPPPIR